jgi:hypothetical protein
MKDEIIIEYLNNNLYKSNIDNVYKFDNIYNSNLDDYFKNKFNLSSIDNFSNILSNKYVSNDDSYFKESKGMRNILKIQKHFNKRTVFEFLTSSNLEQKELIKKINRTEIFSKYKSGDVINPKNYRYFQNHTNEIKVICNYIKFMIDIVLKDDYINTDIFICKIKANQNIKNCREYAVEYTSNMDRLLLLDLEKAFDSIEFEILYEILNNFFDRNILEEYKECKNYIINIIMIILINRDIYYKDNKIKCERGLPQGLPISTLLFVIITDEIIYKWNKINKEYNNIEKLKIYVDDIYIKFKDYNNSLNDKYIINLIEHLKKYYLKINISKCKVDEKLNLNYDFDILTKYDCYLGIAFTRDIYDLSKIFQTYLNIYNNKQKKNYIIYDVYYILYNDISKFKLKYSLNGWLYYKFNHILDYYKITQKELLEMILTYNKNIV